MTGDFVQNYKTMHVQIKIQQLTEVISAKLVTAAQLGRKLNFPVTFSGKDPLLVLM